MKQSAKVTASTTAVQSMDRLRVHRVVQVENARLLDDYQRERMKICARTAGHDVVKLEEHAPTWLTAKAGFPAVLNSDVNEFQLWHGTTATIDNGTVQRHPTWE